MNTELLFSSLQIEQLPTANSSGKSKTGENRQSDKIFPSDRKQHVLKQSHGTEVEF